MGQHCFKPKNILKFEQNSDIKRSEKYKKIENSNYTETLKLVLEDIYIKFLKSYSEEDLISRTKHKGSIISNHDNYQSKRAKIIEPIFFTDRYSLKELEEELNNCSNSDSSPYTDEDLEMSPIDLNDDFVSRILNGSVDDIRILKRKELDFLLNDVKIHIEFSKNASHIRMLDTILQKACDEKIIEDVIDLFLDDKKNSAISVAVLHRNVGAFFLLMKKYYAHIPLHLYEEEGQTPFLIYIAKNGRLKKSMNNLDNKNDFLLNHVLDILIENYGEREFLEHLQVKDEKTNMSLPHYLLYIHMLSEDLREKIMECFIKCIKKYPECADVMCVSYHCPEFIISVTANFLACQNIDVKDYEQCLGYLKDRIPDKNVLKVLIKVHNDKEKQLALSNCLDNI